MKNEEISFSPSNWLFASVQSLQKSGFYAKWLKLCTLLDLSVFYKCSTLQVRVASKLEVGICYWTLCRCGMGLI